MLVILGFMFVSATSSESDAFADECVTSEQTTTGLAIKIVSCDEPHIGKVVEVVDADETCPTGTTPVVLEADQGKQLCIEPEGGPAGSAGTTSTSTPPPTTPVTAPS